MIHRLLYSYVIGNNDVHAKNLSMRCPGGSTLRSVTPAYDVLHTWPYEGDHRFVPAIRPDGPHDAVSWKHWLGLADEFGLTPRALARLARQVTAAATDVLARATDEDGLPAALQRDLRRVITRRARDLTESG